MNLEGVQLGDNIGFADVKVEEIEDANVPHFRSHDLSFEDSHITKLALVNNKRSLTAR